jgi:hypothetical protein
MNHRIKSARKYNVKAAIVFWPYFRADIFALASSARTESPPIGVLSVRAGLRPTHPPTLKTTHQGMMVRTASPPLYHHSQPTPATPRKQPPLRCACGKVAKLEYTVPASLRPLANPLLRKRFAQSCNVRFFDVSVFIPLAAMPSSRHCRQYPPATPEKTFRGKASVTGDCVMVPLFDFGHWNRSTVDASPGCDLKCCIMLIIKWIIWPHEFLTCTSQIISLSFGYY